MIHWDEMCTVLASISIVCIFLTLFLFISLMVLIDRLPINTSFNYTWRTALICIYFNFIDLVLEIIAARLPSKSCRGKLAHWTQKKLLWCENFCLSFFLCCRLFWFPILLRLVVVLCYTKILFDLIFYCFLPNSILSHPATLYQCLYYLNCRNLFIFSFVCSLPFHVFCVFLVFKFRTLSCRHVCVFTYVNPSTPCQKLSATKFWLLAVSHNYCSSIVYCV